jgi:hypothetical protein
MTHFGYPLFASECVRRGSENSCLLAFTFFIPNSRACPVTPTSQPLIPASDTMAGLLRRIYLETIPDCKNFIRKSYLSQETVYANLNGQPVRASTLAIFRRAIGG